MAVRTSGVWLACPRPGPFQPAARPEALSKGWPARSALVAKPSLASQTDGAALGAGSRGGDPASGDARRPKDSNWS